MKKLIWKRTSRLVLFFLDWDWQLWLSFRVKRGSANHNARLDVIGWTMEEPPKSFEVWLHSLTSQLRYCVCRRRLQHIAGSGHWVYHQGPIVVLGPLYKTASLLKVSMKHSLKVSSQWRLHTRISVVLVWNHTSSSGATQDRVSHHPNLVHPTSPPRQRGLSNLCCPASHSDRWLCEPHILYLLGLSCKIDPEPSSIDMSVLVSSSMPLLQLVSVQQG